MYLHASIVSVYGPSRLDFEAPKLLNLALFAVPDPVLYSNSNPDPDLASRNNADLDLCNPG
jgi:hypothetical protein